MKTILEARTYFLKFYAKYSKYIDMMFRFILALLTFAFVSDHVGFEETLANPAVTVGISVICTFLPMSITAVFAAVMVLIQFVILAPGVAIVSGLVILIMFALYFRFAPGKSIILLLTPISFMLNVPLLVPIVFGLIGGPVGAIPVVFGTIVYFMIAYVKSYATVIETVAETGTASQITAFTQQLFSNKEMWMIMISFTICLLLVYSIRRLAIDHAWEIAVVAGALAYLIMMTFGYVMMDVNLSYVNLIVGSIVAVILAILFKLLVFSVDYSRSEYLQFEDDEYYYYVKAVPKVSVAIQEKTVKKINVRQETEVIDVENVKKVLEESEQTLSKEEVQKKAEQDESEIQKIIEEELNK